MNQDCDLNSDNRDKQKEGSNKDCQLLHLIVAPLFNFDVFKQGEHWGDIFQTSQQYNPKKTDGKKIMNNEDPRSIFYTLKMDSSCQIWLLTLSIFTPLILIIYIKILIKEFVR